MQDKWRHPSRRQALLASAGLLALRGGSPARAQVEQAVTDSTYSLPVWEINAVFSANGMLQPGGVLLFDFGRSDVSWKILGISVDPDWGFDSEITFQPLSQTSAVVKWELCLLDSEVNPVWNALRQANLIPALSRLNALHNHFIQETPPAKFMHGTAIGDPVKIGTALYKALKSNSRQPFESTPPGNTGLPNAMIAKILGGTSMVSGKVLMVDVDRKEKFTESGVALESASQVHSHAHFQQIGNNQAIVNAEFILLPTEVDVVAETLSSKGFKIMAVHNHELFIKPVVYYLHCGATGAPLTLAQSIRAALNQTNSMFQS